MKQHNPKLKFILTVSPVPLTATNSGNHVLVATMESKSVLRAVAGQLARQRSNVDYFPSYEIITSPLTRGLFFEPNQRSISPMGVDFVMRYFFGALDGEASGLPMSGTDVSPRKRVNPRKKAATTESDVVCEEALLEAFGPSS